MPNAQCPMPDAQCPRPKAQGRARVVSGGSWHSACSSPGVPSDAAMAGSCRMHEAIRSSVLPVAFVLLHTTASAQAPRPEVGRPPVVRTEVLVEDPRWAHAVRGAVPPGSIAHGRESDGRPQYICRAWSGRGLHLGKISEGSSGCSVVAQGRPTLVGSYQVLVETIAGGARGGRDGRGAREGRRESIVDLIRRRQAEGRKPVTTAARTFR